jgi:sugar fermentation stimulation protein A
LKFPFPLVSGTLLERQKRFLARVLLPDGAEVWAHCANPGSMKGNAEPGSEIEIMDFGPNHLKTGKKMRYKWIYVKSSGVKVCVDTSLANNVVKEALLAKTIAEFSHYNGVRPEAAWGNSRFDFLLTEPGHADCYLEVKSVSMGEGPSGFFPDSVTKRGQKHLEELMALKDQKKRAAMLFLLVREEGQTVSPADWIDPQYGKLLRESVAKGIEIVCYNIRAGMNEIVIGDRVNLLLP